MNQLPNPTTNSVATPEVITNNLILAGFRVRVIGCMALIIDQLG